MSPSVPFIFRWRGRWMFAYMEDVPAELISAAEAYVRRLNGE
jgi:hypothetical protein